MLGRIGLMELFFVLFIVMVYILMIAVAIVLVVKRINNARNNNKGALEERLETLEKEVRDLKTRK